MSSSRQHGDVPPTYSEILEYYFNAIDDASTDIVSAGLASNDGSSAYSTDTPEVDVAKAFEEHEKCGSGLRLAFQGLCQVGLHIASLRHDREKADEPLSRAEEKVDRGAQELLLQQLTSDDNIDSTDQIMSEIASALMAASLSSAQALQDNGQSRAGLTCPASKLLPRRQYGSKPTLGI